MLDKHCKNLKNVLFKEGKFVYVFENITIKSKEKIDDMFKKYGYVEKKSVTMPLNMKEILKGCFKRI